MEVSGQKIAEQTDVKLCSFCEDFDITTSADGFCVECEVFTCQKCFDKHKGRKINRDHSLIKDWDSDYVKTSQTDSYELCQEHNDEFTKYYCPTHDQACCGECMILHHNGCKLESVRDKAIAFQNSDHLKELSKDIQKCIKQAHDSTSMVESNIKILTDLHEQFVREVDSFVDKLIEHINNMKAVILDKGKEIMLKDARRIDDLNKKIDELIAEVSQQEDRLESKRDQPNKLFVASISLKTELKTSQQHLDLLKKKNTVTHYTFKQDQTLKNFLKENKNIGVLDQQQETAKQKQNSVKQTVEAKQSFDKVPQVQDTTLDKRSNVDEFADRGAAKLDVFDSRTKQKHDTNKQTHKQGKSITEEKTMSVSQDQYQPLIQRQLLCKNINIDGQFLSYAARTENGVGLYVDNRLLKVRDSFKIEILSIGSSGSIAVGVVKKDYNGNRLPGLDDGSKGYHSDGKVYDWGEDHGKWGEPWKKGDRVGCRISRDFLFHRFTCTQNGREIYRFETFNSFDLFGQYRFAVGMLSQGDIVKVIN